MNLIHTLLPEFVRITSAIRQGSFSYELIDKIEKIQRAVATECKNTHKPALVDVYSDMAGLIVQAKYAQETGEGTDDLQDQLTRTEEHLKLV